MNRGASLKSGARRQEIEDTVVSPDGDIAALELADVIDAKAIQSLMDHFYELARIPMAIIDLKGKVLVGVGWQQICSTMHRVNPSTARNCIESDLQLTADVPPGEFKLYKCKNNMWDVATPIMVGDRKVGNLFSGQFFFDDEPLDFELFRDQARRYGFDEEKYLSALRAVPRLSKAKLETGMAFFLKLAHMVSQLSYSNIKLARSLEERDVLMESIKEAGERLSQAEEIAHLGSWHLDLLRNQLHWSDEVYRIFGLAPQEFGATYEAFLEAVHPEDRATVDDAYTCSVRDGLQSYEVEHRVVRRTTGEVRWVHEKCMHVRDASGKIIRSVGMVLDITDRKRAEQALLEIQEDLRRSNDELEERVRKRTAALLKVNRELGVEIDERRRAEQAVGTERQRLNDLLELLPVYVALLSPDYHVPFANSFFRERFGEPRGRRCYEFLFNRTEPCETCETYTVMKTNAPHHWEWTGPDGRNYDIFDFPFKDSDGSRLIMEMGIDVTERKTAQTELLLVNAELEKRAVQLRSLTAELYQTEDRERRRLAQVLHDHLQQLLVAANFSIAAMAMRQRSEDSRPQLENVRHLVDEAIQVSRSLTAELAPPVLYERDLEEALRWLARWMQEKHQLEVTVSADNHHAPLPQDVRVMLFQVVRELLFNTAKHAKVGRADLTLRHLSDGALSLTVKDEGRGFDPQRVGSGERAEAGFGLLSIRERLAATGGTLSLVSAPGMGTSATVYIPSHFSLMPVPRERAIAGLAGDFITEEKTSSEGRIRVLIADDHKIVREGLVQLLGHAPDIEVVGQATDGLEAVNLAGRLRPDVIVMDVSMPNMSGLEATRRIRAAFPECRVIALTMHSASDMEAALRAAGAEEYIEKTGASQSLVSAIRKLGKAQ